MAKTHFSAAELAAMRLPGMPATHSNFVKLIARENWPGRKRAGRGGGMEYALAAMPKPVAQAVYLYMHAQESGDDAASAGHAVYSASAGRGGDSAVTASAVVGGAHLGPRRDGNHLVAKQNGGSSVAVPAPRARASLDPAALNTHQREVKDARKAITAFVDDYPGSVKGALNHLNLVYADGLLNTHLAWAYEHCHDKKRGGQTLNAKTYYNWLESAKQRASLAPAKKEKDFSVKDWHAPAVALRKRPQGSTFRWIHEQLIEQGYTVSYDAVCEFFREQFSSLDQLKGRYTGSKLRSHKFYQHRTAEGLAPADEVHADGWNTHFSAPHPVTGEFVTYEVWHFHDVATRYVTPPGIGLTEQFEVIAKGLENFIRVLGRMLIVQTDSTKIIRGSERFTKAAHSLEERVGCTIVHPQEVGNSQANGICENFNTSWLDKQSRALATYQSPKQMDELSFKRVKKLTGAMVKAAAAGDLVLAEKKHTEAERMGKGRVFTSAEEARDWILKICADYNDRPHRSLKKVRGEDGKSRHQTPNEALAEHRANGWEPVAVDEETLIDLFRPVARCKVTRETVTPYGGMRYRNAEVLGHWNGKEVIVSYDIHDYRAVLVKTLDGEMICTAEFVAATGYRVQSAYDAAEEKRAKAQIRSHENKIKKIRAERMSGDVIEGDVIDEDGLISVRNLIGPQRTEKPAPLKTVRELIAEQAQANPQSPAEKPAKAKREMTWEETKMYLYGGGKDLREEDETEPEKEAAQ